jgi:hypothetical protein
VDANRTLAALLAFGRLGIGASVWMAPRSSMHVLGFDPDNPQVVALARLAGTRDIALGGAAAACAGDPLAAATITRLNAAVDALDSVAFGIALVRRSGINRAALVGTVGAAAAAALGAGLASRLDAQGAEEN